MNLTELLGKPVDQMSEEELIESIASLKKLRPGDVFRPTKTTGEAKPKKVIKSNEDKQLESLMKLLTPEQLKLIKEGMDAKS